MSTTYYLDNDGMWKTKERIVLDAIDIVCGACDYIPEDETGIDPCEGCKVVETAARMLDKEKRVKEEE